MKKEIPLLDSADKSYKCCWYLDSILDNGISKDSYSWSALNMEGEKGMEERRGWDVGEAAEDEWKLTLLSCKGRNPRAAAGS